MFKEFKEFISRGNVLDLAIGIVIGAAFTAIVNSFVKDILSPIIGIVGKANFDEMSLTIKDGVVLKYGSFLTNVVNFLIVSFALFLVVKAANKLIRKPQPVEEKSPEPTREEVLLAEIRDLLAKPRA